MDRKQVSKYISHKYEEKVYRMGQKTCNALSTCSGAIVLFSSLLQTSLDSDEMRFINSARA